ncbi:MAG: excinuclease ABC subunit C [Coleofasciculaceae cyanobacterium SM2_3_26]|nr:excinuclease ABC subunit C [Coleofasciculaceae cyanobacterium SM2_3_26]
MIADAEILQLPKVALRAKQLLPEHSGIYYVLDAEDNTVWYIGKAKNICKRWQGKTHHRIYQLEAQRKRDFAIYYEEIPESRLDDVEKQRIEKYHPHLNSTPVKSKKVRPTETLLRETIIAIADFAFIVGVEPPRESIQSQIDYDWMKPKKLLGLNIIHVCLDTDALREKYQPSQEELGGLVRVPFQTRKAYASKWEAVPPSPSIIQRLYVNGYAIEVDSWKRWFFQTEPEGLREYIDSTLARESIRALTPESLAKIQSIFDSSPRRDLHINRLEPYTSELIEPVFREPVDSEAARATVQKVSNEYKQKKRGIDSRRNYSQLKGSVNSHIEHLLRKRSIDSQKYYKGSEVIRFDSIGEKMGLYVRCFDTDLTLEKPYRYALGVDGDEKHPVYNRARGVLGAKKVQLPPHRFQTVYLLGVVDRRLWLLFEEYLMEFAKPAMQLLEGEAYVEKFHVSPRKYLEPAKISMKLGGVNRELTIPFGKSEEFPSFELAKQEIRKRLENSGIPGLQLTFKREAIAK